MEPATPFPFDASRPAPRLRIAIHGAARSGKTQLARALASASPQLDVFECPSSGPAEADLHLLTGLDLPPSAGGPEDQIQQDAKIRAGLSAAGLSWRVIYGRGPDRLRNALQAVTEVAPWAWQPSSDPQEAGRWARLRANCEKCGDAACEHRLFTGLGGSVY